jgi:hypothetical protein
MFFTAASGNLTQTMISLSTKKTSPDMKVMLYLAKLLTEYFNKYPGNLNLDKPTR